MSTQSLMKLVVIVWSVAIAVAVFVGLPALLTALGVEINAGLIVSALAAVASFSAAGIALLVALSAQRERQQERDAADEAQAALVVAQPFTVVGGGKPPRIGVVVHNYGTSAILQVMAVRMEVDGLPPLERRQGGAGTYSVVAPRRDGDKEDGASFFFEPDDNELAFRRALEAYVAGESDETAAGAPTITRNTWLKATVRFTDSKGSRWKTVFRAPALDPRGEDFRRIVETYHVSPSPKWLSRRQPQPPATAGKAWGWLGYKR